MHQNYGFSKTILVGLLLFLSLSLSGQLVQVTGSSFPNLPATSCTNTNIDVDLQLGCANLIHNANTFTISGSTITVNVDYLLGIFCLPAIVNVSHTINLGNIPAGNYSVVINGQENGSTVSTINTTLTVNSCCSATADFSLSTDSICPGDSVAFTNNSTGGSSRAWYINNNQVSNQVNFGQRFFTPGNHTVKLVVNATSCSDSLEKNIWVYNNTVDLGSDTILCAGNSLVLTAPSGLDSLMWSTGTNALSITVSSAGRYYLTTYKNGCQASDTIDVSLSNNPPNLGADTTICQGDTLRLEVTQPGATYLWQDSSTQSYFEADTAGLYYVSRTDSNGCSASDTIEVLVTNCNSNLIEQSADISLALYPNPFQNELTLDFSEKINSPMQVRVYSLQGKLVLEENKVSELSSSIILNLSGLENGLYMIRLSNDSFSQSALIRKN